MTIHGIGPAGPGSNADPLHISRGLSLGAGSDLPPGLSFEQWLEATGLSFNVGAAGQEGGTLQNLEALQAGFQAYRALSGGFDVPDAPPEAPELSLRIDKERTGAGDLRINTVAPTQGRTI